MATKVDKKRRTRTELIPGEDSIPLLGALAEVRNEAIESGVNIVEGGANTAKKAVEGAVGGAEQFALKVAVNSLLILIGVALVIYGIMVAVKPPESALALPKVVPVPVPA